MGERGREWSTGLKGRSRSRRAELDVSPLDIEIDWESDVHCEDWHSKQYTDDWCWWTDGQVFCKLRFDGHAKVHLCVLRDRMLALAGLL